MSAEPIVSFDLRQTWRVLSTCFAIASVGGLFKGLANRLRVRDVVLAAGISGTGGLVVGALCVYAWGHDRWYLTCATCGLAGWAGGNVVLDRLTFVAWTILKGYAGAKGLPAEPKPVKTGPLGYVDLDLPELQPRRH